MSENEKARENEIFAQSVSVDELDAASGGNFFHDSDADGDNCVQTNFRDVYGGNGFPHCAATVEDGSFCNYNDACHIDSVVYVGMKDCAKAWR